MPSKRNSKTKIIGKSRNFRQKKEQAAIEEDSDDSFSDVEYQPEPFGKSDVARDSEADSGELPKRNKVSVLNSSFPLFEVLKIGASSIKCWFFRSKQTRWSRKAFQ